MVSNVIHSEKNLKSLVENLFMADSFANVRNFAKIKINTFEIEV